jgi:hypothetical protein
MEDFRGKELGVHASEAFIRITARGGGKLIFLTAIIRVE